MQEKILTLRLLKEKYGVCRLNKSDLIPQWATSSDFFSITKTSEELSIVCLQNNIPDEIKCEKDWKILKIESILDFSLVGILSKISAILAQNEISIFAVSTYNTDYILIKDTNVDIAVSALVNENYEVLN